MKIRERKLEELRVLVLSKDSTLSNVFILKSENRLTYSNVTTTILILHSKLREAVDTHT